MAHPYQEHRQHHVERNRVHHIAGTHEETRTHHIAHRARGGRTEHHSDEAEDKAMVKHMVKSSALKGEKPHHRQDKMKRAAGGRTKHKGHGKTNVNVIVAPQGGHPAAPMPGPAAGLGPAPAPAPMPPRPPMGAGAPGLPPGGPPGMPPGGPMIPPGLGPRRHGGRTYAKGGAVKEEGMRAGTQPWNLKGKGDGKDIGRGKPVTYATGGPIYAPAKGHMGPKPPGGSGGAEARLFKEARARRHYAKA